MKTTFKTTIIAGLAALVLTLPAGATEGEIANPDPHFTRAQLAQMLAPIALYPDSLLAQILMAATYPIEVVEAARWVKQYPALKGILLDDALKEKTWDVSVKSLTHFPQILSRMSEQIGQTATLGNAFLAQQTDVMDTVQELRARARAAGNLETTEQQTVIAEEETIRIEPANPRVIYVPAYYPSLVYGTWWYPGYPPYAAWYPAWYPPSGFVSFGAGLWVGAAIGWCDFNWHRRVIHVYHHHTRPFYPKTYFHRRPHRPGTHAWRHDPVHRRGVTYRKRTASRPTGWSLQVQRKVRKPGHPPFGKLRNRRTAFEDDRPKPRILPQRQRNFKKMLPRYGPKTVTRKQPALKGANRPASARQRVGAQATVTPPSPERRHCKPQAFKLRHPVSRQRFRPQTAGAQAQAGSAEPVGIPAKGLWPRSVGSRLQNRWPARNSAAGARFRQNNTVNRGSAMRFPSGRSFRTFPGGSAGFRNN